jgi:hypothetical protein
LARPKHEPRQEKDKMKIVLDSNLYIYKVFDPPVELTLEEGSVLRNILETLRSMLGTHSEPFQFLQDTGETGKDIDKISLNGKDYLSLRQGLKTPLKEGDQVRVDILNFPLSGG